MLFSSSIYDYLYGLSNVDFKLDFILRNCHIISTSFTLLLTYSHISKWKGMENDECNEPEVTAVVDKAARGGETLLYSLNNSAK